MKRTLYILLIIVTALSACKKEDKIQPIDMTGVTYSANATYKGLPVILQLQFYSNGNATIQAFPDSKTVTLRYLIEDPNSENTTLMLGGTLDKTLSADGFISGEYIAWKAGISRLKYKTNIVGFTVDGYHFISKQ